MARWQLTLSPDTLDRGSPGPGADGAERLPLFVRIARSIAEDIRRGRLRPGQELSSSRLLARELGVHRNTVLAAYRELAAEGWIVAEQAKGPFVSDELPEASPRRLSPARGQTLRPANTSGYDLPTARLPRPRATLPSNVLSMAGGKPDMRLAPTNEISRAFRRALRAHGRTLLDYGDSAGHPGLRRALLTS